MLRLEVNDALEKRKDRIKVIELKQGEVVALLGENGVGKTTLIRQIFGVCGFRQGGATLDGEPVSQKNLHRLALGSSEHTFFGEFTVEEQKEFYLMNFPNFNEKRFDVLVEYFRVPMHRKMKKMSLGEKNQVETIFALCQGADYIFLDEPFANNDVFRRKDFYKLLLGLMEEHECLVIVTHLVEEIDHLVSRAILMDHFQVIGDVTVDELDEREIDLLTWLKEMLGYDEKRASELIRRMEAKYAEEKN